MEFIGSFGSISKGVITFSVCHKEDIEFLSDIPPLLYDPNEFNSY
jgi:hypothetical protein